MKNNLYLNILSIFKDLQTLYLTKRFTQRVVKREKLPYSNFMINDNIGQSFPSHDGSIVY